MTNTSKATVDYVAMQIVNCFDLQVGLGLKVIDADDDEQRDDVILGGVGSSRSGIWDVLAAEDEDGIVDDFAVVAIVSIFSPFVLFDCLAFCVRLRCICLAMMERLRVTNLHWKKFMTSLHFFCAWTVIMMSLHFLRKDSALV